MHIPFSENEPAILWQHTDNKLVRVLLIYLHGYASHRAIYHPNRKRSSQRAVSCRRGKNSCWA